MNGSPSTCLSTTASRTERALRQSAAETGGCAQAQHTTGVSSLYGPAATRRGVVPLRRHLGGVLLAPLIFALVLAGPLPARADHHAGYYYPIPQTSETYKAQTATLADSNRARRVAFVTEITNEMWGQPYAPTFALFAKGDEADEMIITALSDHEYNTIYRMRGLLAMLTARARATPIFRDLRVQDTYTFFELLKMLGFKQLTVTDGERFAHRILIR